jgi:tRNA(Ile2) C34 agmatinyltransferase TiaS
VQLRGKFKYYEDVVTSVLSEKCEMCGGDLELLSMTVYSCKECQTRYSRIYIALRKSEDVHPGITEEMMETYRGYKTKW